MGTPAEDQARESIWLHWFEKVEPSWRCKRHGFIDLDSGGICPSCARYAFNTAFLHHTGPILVCGNCDTVLGAHYSERPPGFRYLCVPCHREIYPHVKDAPPVDVDAYGPSNPRGPE